MKMKYEKVKVRGVTTVEYAVMLVLISIAVLTSSPGISEAINNVFSSIASRLTA